MIWLTWRQFRTPAAVAIGGLLVVAVVCLITGPGLVHLYDTNVASCSRYRDCGLVRAQLFTNDPQLRSWLDVLVLVVPGLVGIFWGAPLVARELETGSFRLGWTQSVTRGRWLAVKLSLLGVASMLTAGLVSLMVTWWSSPFDKVNMTPFASFDHRDIVPVGYAAFAFMLGVSAGAVIRRTLPAMAATLVAFVGLRLADWEWLRPYIISPLKLTTPLQLQLGTGPGSLGGGAISPSAWVISDQTINAVGKVIGQNGGFGPNGNIGLSVNPNGIATLPSGQVCPNKVPVPTLGQGPTGKGGPGQSVNDTFRECIAKLHIREALTYQPRSRYWALQWYELAIFVGLALILAGFCFWWVRRRLT